MSLRKAANDTSVLAMPIELASSLNQQVLDARATGTKETLTFLEHECDVVLECRMCRSMFRSLANFISHKRIFCQLLYRDQKAPFPLVAQEAIPVLVPDNYSSVTPLHVTNVPDPRKVLTHRRKGRPTRKPVSLVQAVLLQSQAHRNVELKTLEGTSVAVSQTVAREEVNTPLNEMKSEPVSTGLPSTAGNITEGPTSTPRLASAKPGMVDALLQRTDCDVDNLKCLTCNLVYASAKSLKSHMDEQHGLYKKVWTCPRCPNEYSKFWGVGKHMKNRHKASDEEVTRLKSRIKPKRVLRETMEPRRNNQQPVDSTADEAQTIDVEDVQPESPDEALNGSSTMEDFSCELCEKPFTRIQYLNQHRVACARKFGVESPIEKEERAPVLYMCTLCNRAFDHRKKRENHICANKNGEEGRRFECEFCHRKFSMIQHHNQHKVACRLRSAEASNATDKMPQQTAYGSSDLLPKTNGDVLDPTLSDGFKPSLSRSRPKRAIKRRTFPDHESSDVPEVVKVRQLDGATCYKLREDVLSEGEEILEDSPSESSVSPKAKSKRRREASKSANKNSIELDLMISIDEPLNITDDTVQPHEMPLLLEADAKKARGRPRPRSRPRKAAKTFPKHPIPTPNKESSPMSAHDENQKTTSATLTHKQTAAKPQQIAKQAKKLEGLLSNIKTRKPLTLDAAN